MSRRNFLIVLAYDGGDFSGWQRLPGIGRSVQGSVEEALCKALGGAVEITGAGRTDAGVHAEGQAASFHAHSLLDCNAIRAALNSFLPGDIVCRSCVEVDPRFHARFRAKAKVYRYRLHVASENDPFIRRYSYHVSSPLDLGAMAAAGRELQGEHDFRAFTNAKDVADGQRRLDEVRVEANGDFVDLYFAGEGFLYNQVRIMAALLLEAGRGRMRQGETTVLLAGADRTRVPGALGPYALSLVEVRYDHAPAYDSSAPAAPALEVHRASPGRKGISGRRRPAHGFGR
jgi:tRNA pseudouridine38-40 synthase